MLCVSIALTLFLYISIFFASIRTLTIRSWVPSGDTAVPFRPTSDGSVWDIQLVTMAMVLSTAPIFSMGTLILPECAHSLPGDSPHHRRRAHLFSIPRLSGQGSALRRSVILHSRCYTRDQPQQRHHHHHQHNNPRHDLCSIACNCLVRTLIHRDIVSDIKPPKKSPNVCQFKSRLVSPLMDTGGGGLALSFLDSWELQLLFVQHLRGDC